MYKTLSQIICLLGLCIGLYRSDIVSIAILFSILVGCVWFIPNIISVIFKEKKNDDGVIYVESMDDGKTEFHLAIKSPITAIKKDYLTIKVEVPKNLWEGDDDET